MWKILSIHHLIETTTQFNALIFFFGRIPLLKRIIPNNVSRLKDIKWLYQALSILTYFFKKIFQALLFILGLIGISLYLNSKFHLSLPNETICLTTLIFSFLIIPCLGSIWVDSDRTTLIAYKVFKLPIRTYLFVKNSYDEIFDNLVSIFILSIFRQSLGLTLLEIISLVLLSSSFKLLLAYLSLFTYQYDDISPYQKTILGLGIIILLSFICYCLILGFAITLPFSLILSPITALISLILSFFLLYRLKNEQRIGKIAKNLLTFNRLITTTDEPNPTDGFKIEDKEISYQTTEAMDISQQEPIAYLNTIFFNRLYHYLKKKIRYKIVTLLIIIIVCLPIIVINKHTLLRECIHYYLPISTTVALIFYPSEFYTKFCFYHLDKNFLRYRFYRQRQNIIPGILNRFCSILKLEIPMFIMMTTFWIILFIMSKQINYITLLSLILNQTILFLIFSSVHLILYYLFQPFTEGIEAKSPIYNFCNHILNMGSFSFFGLFTKYMTSTVMIIIFLSYCVIVLLTILYITPKTFKLR